jgi:uncharacterized protein (TIGR02453 family)
MDAGIELKTVLSFLKKLESNNSKEWMDLNKKEYEKSKEYFLKIVDFIIKSTSKIDATVAHLEPKKTIFRINRDIRFSSNKAPYKNNFGSSINRDGKKSNMAGYYLHIQNNGTFIGAGVYMPQADVLQKIRQEIDYNTKGFEKTVSSKSFKEYFVGLDDSDKLKTAPKGYDKEAQNIEWLKLKSFIAVKNFSNTEVLSPDFLSEVVKGFKIAKPLVDFINEPLLSE